ncbi:MAG: TIGR04211 family SH3 domain-containing protein [Deltaproteobacteria bacterium]|nr:TIGR04211 family SH3 domain-containing protein [Deltaproteobacteria bacterium]MBW2362554.1 TIGR04211 family SH3 domain-containing protein [Deltaproteobacteria bacterium]
MSRRLALLLGGFIGLLGLPAESHAERAWIKDEVHLNKRTGPGTKYRILGAVKTGDAVEVLSRTEGWTQVRDGDGEAWIPVGFLQSEPPARIQLERHVAESTKMRADHSELTTEVEKLRQTNAELAERSSSLDELAKKLERENFELRAGARWPEWIAGASILIVGGILGMIVHASGARRQTRRIRL